MAANYWDSTQARNWTFTKPELAAMDASLAEANRTLHTKHPLPDKRHVAIFLQQSMAKLGRRLNLRAQVLATATTYVRRFYLRVELRRTNPYLLMTTALYLACKTEECPVHIRFMLGEAARHWPELGVSDTSRIGECEFHLISTLESNLVVHHPFRTLGEIGAELQLTPEDLALATSVVTDAYVCDLVLLFPPHVLAVTGVFLAVVLRPTPAGLQAHAAPAAGAGQVQNAMAAKGHHAKVMRVVEWLAEVRVDVEMVAVAVQEMISLYDVWESYSERTVKDAISKWLKEGQ